MKKLLFLTSLVCTCILKIQAQEIKYDTASIADSLKKNTSVVKRYDHTIFEVYSIERASVRHHVVYTILTTEGRSALEFAEYSDKFMKLDEAEIKVYDVNGKQINHYKKKDMTTSAYIGDGLIEDGEFTHFRVSAPTLPITVEYDYKTDYKGILRYPSYYIISAGESVENSGFSAKIPKELDLRFKAERTSIVPKIVEDDKYKTYTWDVKNLKSMVYEEGAPDSYTNYPIVLLGPNKFKFDAYEGDQSTWKSFGMWYASLYKGLDEFPENKKVFFQQMTKDAKTDREKIKIIYNYLQKNFRYVSIQLGIGGLKPFSAEFTDNKKYGDCKALSNFMHAALKAVNINSYNAVINAGVDAAAIDPTFPGKFSNHVILCVPLPASDTVWLECTSNTTDFAILGNFTENRNALLITENGGVLVPTPKSKASDNIFSASTKISMQEDGSGKTMTNITASGEYKQNLINYVFNEKKDDQKSFIVNNYGFKQPDEFSIDKNEDGDKFTTNLSLSIEKIPEFVAGSKMFLTPRLYKIWKSKLPKAENRQLDYYFGYPFEKTDTTIFKLPEGFVSDALPAEKNIKCDFASYSTKYWYNANDKSVYSTAKLVLLQHKIPADKYASVKTFFDDVLKEDAQRIVIKKQ